MSPPRSIQSVIVASMQLPHLLQVTASYKMLSVIDFVFRLDQTAETPDAKAAACHDVAISSRNFSLPREFRRSPVAQALQLRRVDGLASSDVPTMFEPRDGRVDSRARRLCGVLLSGLEMTANFDALIRGEKGFGSRACTARRKSQSSSPQKRRIVEEFD
jgi:hypothetical protein